MRKILAAAALALGIVVGVQVGDSAPGETTITVSHVASTPCASCW